MASRHALVAILYSHARGFSVAAAPGAQQRLLDEILGFVEGTEHAVAVDVELVAVLVEHVSVP